MLRIVIAVSLFLLMYCANVTAGASTAAAAPYPPDIQRILNRGALVVAMYHNDVTPFFMHDAQGNLVGYDVELAENIAQALGVKVVFDRQATTFDGLIDELSSGRADIAVSLLSRTLPRALKVNFTTPYLLLPEVLLTNRLQSSQLGWENHVVSELSKADKRVSIGVLDKSSYLFYALNLFSQQKIVPYQNMSKAMQDVAQGKIFAVLYDDVEIRSWLIKNPDAALYVQMVPVRRRHDPISIAVAWPDTHLLNWLNIYLTSIREDGIADALGKKYLEQVTNEKNL